MSIRLNQLRTRVKIVRQEGNVSPEEYAKVLQVVVDDIERTLSPSGQHCILIPTSSHDGTMCTLIQWRERKYKKRAIKK